MREREREREREQAMQNYIKLNGYISKSHQHTVFNTLVNRLLSTPLKQTEYTEEYKKHTKNIINKLF